MNELDTLVVSARESFAQAQTPADLENAKALYTGKSGRITEMMKGMAALSVDEKKTLGAAINLAKQAIEGALNERRQALQLLTRVRVRRCWGGYGLRRRRCHRPSAHRRCPRLQRLPRPRFPCRSLVGHRR